MTPDDRAGFTDDPAAFPTVRAALASVTAELTSAGSRAPQADADLLMEWATGWSRTRILTSGADALPPEAANRLREAVAQRRRGVPVQYITGQAGFYGRLFAVREGCLIPRPETEVLAEAAIDWITTHAPTAHIVDLGSGSGALAVTLALECPQARVTALDVSPEAVAITEQNALRLGANISVMQTDGFAWLAAQAASPGGGRTAAEETNAGGQAPPAAAQRRVVQVLVSNPPYIPSAVIEELDAEVRDFEPILALDGGADGLDPYRRLADLGDAVFSPVGPVALFLEVGDDQADAVTQLFTNGTEPNRDPNARLSRDAAIESSRGANADDGGPQCRWPGWRFWDIADLRGVRRIVAGVRL